MRRFQNPDGTLTEAGKRRLGKLEEKVNKLKPKEDGKPKPTPNPHGHKSVFDMSDDELRIEIDRLGLEKRYKDYMNDLYAQPKQQSRHLVDRRKIVGDILSKSVTAVGTSVATNTLGRGINEFGKRLGLDYELYTKSKKRRKEED